MNANIQLTERLDDLESSLPAVPAKSVALTRAAARRVADTTTAAVDEFVDRVRPIISSVSNAQNTVCGQTRSAVERSVGTAQRGVAQVTGQARSAVGRTVDTAQRGAAEVTGQARTTIDRTVSNAQRGAAEVRGQVVAQAERVGSTIADETEDLLDSAVESVAPEPSTRSELEALSKAELYERAQELDIDGRSSMSKKQLVNALSGA